MANNNASQGFAWVAVLTLVTICLLRLGWSIVPLGSAAILTLYFIVVFLNSIGAKPKRLDHKGRSDRGSSHGDGDRTHRPDAS